MFDDHPRMIRRLKKYINVIHINLVSYSYKIALSSSVQGLHFTGKTEHFTKTNFRSVHYYNIFSMPHNLQWVVVEEESKSRKEREKKEIVARGYYRHWFIGEWMRNDKISSHAWIYRIKSHTAIKIWRKVKGEEKNNMVVIILTFDH